MLCLLLAASAGATVVTSLTLAGGAGERTVLSVADDDATAFSVRREGGAVLVSFTGSVAGDVTAPDPVPPVTSVRVERGALGVVIRLGVREEIPFEVRRDGPRLSVLFGEQPAPAEPPQPDTLELLRSILPPPGGAAEPAGTATGEPAAAEPKLEAPREGLMLGSLTLRPALEGSWVDGESSVLDQPQPVADRYLELRPRLGAEWPTGRGSVLAGYEARIRRGSAFPLLDSVTHLVDGSFDLALGASLVLRAAGHHARGSLETNEVDPGYEYFFGLAPFRRSYLSAGARLQLGPRLDLDASAWRNDVDVDPEARFFDFAQEGLGGSLGFEATPGLRAALSYGFDRVPSAPSRPEAENRAHALGALVSGELLPLVRGELAVGFRTQENPNAGAEGRRFEDWVASARLSKEFARGALLQAGGGRATFPSAFEENGFYVSNFGALDLTLPLPLGVAASAGLSYRVNDYRVSAGAGEPRRDTLRGWALGLGRPLTRWGFLRLDYREDRRRSNLPAFDTDTHSLLIQAGLGYRGRVEPAR
jgi:hypothetical protein